MDSFRLFSAVGSTQESGDVTPIFAGSVCVEWTGEVTSDAVAFREDPEFMSEVSNAKLCDLDLLSASEVDGCSTGAEKFMSIKSEKALSILDSFCEA